MRILILGRTKALYNTAEHLEDNGHKVVAIVTAQAAPEYEKTTEDFEQLANELEAEFLYEPDIDKNDIINLIEKSDSIDLGVSVNYPNIIKQKVIDQFRFGILNAHGGDLPRYRGNAAQAWAIINGEDKIGLVVHKMVGGRVDAGDILAREYLELSLDTRIGEVYRWMQDNIPSLFLKSIEALENDPNFFLEKQEEREKEPLRCYPRKPKDGKNDWGQPAVDILRLINASTEPYSGAFCKFKKDKLFIWRAALVKNPENFLAIPGQVAAIDNKSGDVEICCGEGKLRLKEVEFKDKRDKPAEFINSHRTRLV